MRIDATMEGTIVQVNISRGGLPKRAIDEGSSRRSASRGRARSSRIFTADR